MAKPAHPRTAHQITRRLGIGAAAALMALAIVSPASAAAATVAGSATMAPADSSEVSGTVSGTENQCSYAWRWEVTPGFGGSSEVEWTSNPCSLTIQERSWCKDPSTGNGSWATSGVVKRVGLWDQSICSASTEITRGEVSIASDTFSTFWTSS